MGGDTIMAIVAKNHKQNIYKTGCLSPISNLQSIITGKLKVVTEKWREITAIRQ